MTYYYAKFNTLVPLIRNTALDELTSMADRVMCYPRTHVGALHHLGELECWEAAKRVTGIDPHKVWS